MANFDQLSCTTTGSPGNTGFDPNCYLDIQQIIWAALVPSSMVIPKQYLTPTAIIPYLTSLARNDDPAQRIYPIGNLTLETAGGGDRREYTDNYGNKLTTGENPYEWTFQYTKGGAQLQASLRKFNTMVNGI